ncbi:MAG: zinc ABC transporter substrate-binding protein [Asgard group archaeon]|nr:zinc ABC transporter substrate-binding protein [Asgard group archaeon]
MLISSYSGITLRIFVKLRSDYLKKLTLSLMLIILIITQLSVTSVKEIKSEELSSKDFVINNSVNVVTSLSIVADFANQIGSGLYVAESIVTGNENPHVYEPTPSEIEMVAQADLFIRFGLEGLEPWVQSVIDVNPGLNVLELVNESMIVYDDIIGANNPHVWMDPNNVKTMVNQIYQRVALLDPINIITYSENKEQYLNDLDLLLNRIAAAKTIYSGTKVVVHHPSFKYLFDLLGIVRIGAIETQDGVEPSPEHIQELIIDIQQENVSLIVNQPQLNENVVNQIARDTHIQIVELTPLLGVFNLSTYISMIDYDILALTHPFDPPTNIFHWSTWFLLGIAGGSLIALVLTIVIIRAKRSKSLKEVFV